MKASIIGLKTCFCSVAAGVLVAGGGVLSLSASETVLFFDDFSGAEINGVPVVPPWTDVTEGGGSLTVLEDGEDWFGRGEENPYLDFDYGDGSPTVLLADDVLAEGPDHELVTIRMRFYEPSIAGRDGALILFAYNGPASGDNRIERLRLNNGGFFAGPPSEGNEVYSLDTVHTLEWVLNNSDQDHTYNEGASVVEARTSDLWIDGRMVQSGYAFEGTAADGPIRGFDIRTFTGGYQTIYIDEFEVLAGATPVTQVPAPWVEFLFNESLANTGVLGGEGEFGLPNPEHEFETVPEFGEGINGPMSGLTTNTRYMGNEGQEDRDGSLYWNSEDPGEFRDMLSITVSGWYKAEEPWMNNGFLVGKPNQVHLYAGTSRVAFAPFASLENPRQQASCPNPWQQETDQWIFLAVTFDGTTDTNNMRFYYAMEGDDALTADAVRSLDSGAIRYVSHEWTFGNSFFGNRPFKGNIDNMRIHASKEDGSGALSRDQVEAIWARDNQYFGEPIPVDVEIVDFEYRNDGFFVAFVTTAGRDYVVEYKDDMNDPEWQEVETVPGDGSVRNVLAPLGEQQRRFYRVRMVD